MSTGANGGCVHGGTIGTRDRQRPLWAYLADRFRHTDEAGWRAHIAEGRVRVDGTCLPAETLLRAGQVVAFSRPPWVEPEVPLGCAILYEDEALVVVAKPSGLPTLPGADFQDHTLLALVRRRHPEASPIHRLGRFTSGLVLFSRTAASCAALCALFRDHDLEKVYLALVTGRPDRDAFAVDVPIGPVYHGSLGTVHAASPEGKRSRSDVRVLRPGAEASLVEVAITTGRPHQIRIHMAACGHPLVGDPLYAPGGGPKPETRALPGDGGYLLHAHRLAFIHPWTGEALAFTCQPPAGLREGGA